LYFPYILIGHHTGIVRWDNIVTMEFKVVGGIMYKMNDYGCAVNFFNLSDLIMLEFRQRASYQKIPR